MVDNFSSSCWDFMKSVNFIEGNAAFMTAYKVSLSKIKSKIFACNKGVLVSEGTLVANIWRGATIHFLSLVTAAAGSGRDW